MATYCLELPGIQVKGDFPLGNSVGSGIKLLFSGNVEAFDQ